MKTGIHPKVVKTTITCSCGEKIPVQSTKEDLKVEICSCCHPFYTGNRGRVASTAGRVEKFKKKYGLAE
mgnify:CR=1 FL=1|jgi:large subunit ribosomal protein L31